MRVPKDKSKQTVTMREVAVHAGVSVGTVSHVLNKTTPVKDDLRRRVLAAIRELGYQPSSLARDFRRSQTNLLGMIIPDITNPFFPAVVRGAEDIAYQHSYRLVLCNTDNDPRKEAQYLQEMRAHRVPGVVLIPSENSQIDAMADADLCGAAIICLDRKPEHWEGDSVTADNIEGASRAIRHLLGVGHRSIAMIVGSLHLTNAQDRIEGFRREMRRAKVEIAPGYIQEGQFSRFSGYQKMQVLLHLRPRPTAIFAGNDLIAFGALAAIREAGLKCPRDISVIGFDDLEISDLSDPPLTTVSQPGYQMGARGVDLLLRRLREPRSKAQSIVLETELKVRQSVASLRLTKLR
jgi:DNA-binding LacI/PurR family transcriptional regulator